MNDDTCLVEGGNLVYGGDLNRHLRVYSILSIELWTRVSSKVLKILSMNDIDMN